MQYNGKQLPSEITNHTKKKKKKAEETVFLGGGTAERIRKSIDNSC